MSTIPTITESEVLAAIRAAHPFQERGSEGFTTRELAQLLNTTQIMAQKHVRELSAAGKLEFIGKRRGIRTDMTPCLVPVYRLKQS